MLANCGCSSAKQSAQSTKSVTTKIEDSGLDLSKYKTLPIKANKTYTLKSNWDLKGETYVLPNGVTLKSKGGVFKNGTLIGNNTKIDTKKPLFNKVSIMGYWNVPEISTGMFASLDYENSLRDVLALTHPEVMNTVVIEDGDYWVSAKSFQPALEVCSNTTLVIDGTIRLLPNNFKGCYVIQLKDAENIVIKGSGSILGDKKDHKGNDGEWGHGINILGTHNITIQDIHVMNCWGDCIYIGDKSSGITIKECIIKEGRRQGISITSAESVTIQGCNISNIYGTNPQYGIDIEPNKGDSVAEVIIEDVVINNCHGGILSWRPDNAHIGKISLRRCVVSGTKVAHPVYIQLADNVVVQNCKVNSVTENCILVQVVDSLVASDNIMTSKGKSPLITRKVNKEKLSNNTILKE